MTVSLYKKTMDNESTITMDGWHHPVDIKWRLSGPGPNCKLFFKMEGSSLDISPVYLSDIYDTFGGNIERFFKKFLTQIREDVIDISNNGYGFDHPNLVEYEKIYRMIKI